MKKIYAVFITICLVFPAWIYAQWTTPPVFTDVPASKVLVVYNDNPLPDGTYTVRDYNGNGINDSRELAEYYQLKRNIPAANMLAVYPNWFEIYTDSLWAQVFWDDIVIPIRNKITALGDTSIYYVLLMEGIHMAGSSTTVTNGVSFDNSLIALNNLGTRTSSGFYMTGNPVLESTPGTMPDLGQFNHNYKVSGTHMYPVARLTHWNLDMEKNLIDMALYGEKYIYPADGYYNGYGYVDVRYGPYDSTALAHGMPYGFSSFADGDSSIATLEFLFEQKNIDYRVEASGSEIGANTSLLFVDGSPADSGRSALLYGGWYNFYHYYPVWDWLPGSFACDLNSGSASKLSYNPNSYNQCWLTNAFSDGLTCATGVYNEPYLSGHSRSNIFLYYFLNGYNFIESAIHAEPYLKWMGAAIGDPLYNPFRAGKTPVYDTEIQPSVISADFINDSTVNVHLDYECTIENPEVVKAQLFYGIASGSYTDTIFSDSLYFAHHNFRFADLDSNTTYYFKICAADPVGNTWCSLEQSFTPDTSTVIITSLPQENIPLDLKVYPNPSNGCFTIAYNNESNEQLVLSIFDYCGSEVYQNTWNQKGISTKTLDLTALQKGIYLIRLSGNNMRGQISIVID